MPEQVVQLPPEHGIRPGVEERGLELLERRHQDLRDERPPKPAEPPALPHRDAAPPSRPGRRRRAAKKAPRRAASFCPGDCSTPVLTSRPQVPRAAAVSTLSGRRPPARITASRSAQASSSDQSKERPVPPVGRTDGTTEAWNVDPGGPTGGASSSSRAAPVSARLGAVPSAHTRLPH